MKGVWLLLLVLAALGGCRFQRGEGMLHEPGKPGLVQFVETNLYRIEIRYLPREYLLLHRAGIDSSRAVTQDLLDSLVQVQYEHGSPGLTFLMKIMPLTPEAAADVAYDVVYQAAGGREGYGDALHAFQFGLQKKIWLEADGLKTEMSAYRMENFFGMSSSRNFMLLFTKPPKGERIQLVLDAIIPGLARTKLDFILPTERI